MSLRVWPFLASFAPRVALAVVVGVTARAALAHDYYLEREGAELALYQGHVQSAHAGDAKVAYDPNVVKAASCIEPDGGARPLPLPQSYPARFAGDCAALTVRTSTGYWSRTADGEVNRPRSEVPGASRAWRSEESLKHIGSWTPALREPLGDRLELVPLGNPLVLARKDKLRLRVAWRGAPLAGIPVAYDGQLRGATDAAGEINIRLRHAGRQLISASLEETLVGDARADAAIYTAVLQFQAAE